MQNQESKLIISKNPPTSIISLKDIPPLDPSSIPTISSLKPITMSDSKFEKVTDEVEEDNANASFSNIQVDPNSTRSLISTTQENTLLPEPQEDTNPISQGMRVLEGSMKGSAKSVLHEKCASKRWRPPVYECCKVEGPCHMRLFTYKVVVEIGDSSGETVLECFGDPKRNKKAAAEHAAEAALWYLEHVNQN